MNRGERLTGVAGAVQSKSPVYQTELWCPRGHFNEAQADKYADLCAEVRPRWVLEVGFCTGRSAACILYAMAGQMERLVSVDRDLDYQSPEGRAMARLLEARFNCFEVVERPSREVLTPAFFATVFPHGVDFATVDGDHSYDGCNGDLEAIAPHLSPDGIMVVDDYRSGPPNGYRLDSVTKAVDDFLDRILRCRESAGMRMGRGSA